VCFVSVLVHISLPGIRFPGEVGVVGHLPALGEIGAAWRGAQYCDERPLMVVLFILRGLEFLTQPVLERSLRWGQGRSQETTPILPDN